MKKVLILTLIFFPLIVYSQENKFERPEYFIGVTPLKPFISSAIGVSFLKKSTETNYYGLESTIYTNINHALYQTSEGVKLYGSYRNFFNEKRLSSFYGQINFGGGYFSESVTYVTSYYETTQEDNYPIDKYKDFVAIGGSAQFGYQLLV